MEKILITLMALCVLFCAKKRGFPYQQFHGIAVAYGQEIFILNGVFIIPNK